MLTPSRRPILFAYLYFLALTLALLAPALPTFGTAFIGDAFSDANEYAHHIWWIAHALRTGAPLFEQPLLGYPDGLGGAWLWGNPFQWFPAWLFAFVMPLPAAYNLGALLHLSLNGFCAALLGYFLTRTWGAALLTGTVFALYPTLQGQLIASHTGLLVLWGVPLYALGLLWPPARTRAGVIRRTLLTAAAFVASVLGSNLLLIYALFPVTAVIFGGWLLRREWRALVRGAAAVILGGAGALVFIGPVALEQLNSSLPPVGGDVRYSADLLAVVAPSFYNPLFANLGYARGVLGGVNNVEGSAYVGVLAGTLALVGLWRDRRARLWGALALAAWVLSLGPLLKVGGAPVTVTAGEVQTHVVLPWALVMDLPLLNIARTPARFNFTVGLAVAALAGYGWAAVPVRWRRAGGLAVVVGLVAFEYQVSWRGNVPHIHTMPYTVPGEIAALRDDDKIRAVFNIPHGHLLAAKDGLMLQTVHAQPMIAGHVTRQTPVDPAKLETLQHTLDPALLDAAGVDAIILHRTWDTEDGPGPVERHTLERLGAPHYTDDRLMLWYTPAATDAPAFAAVPMPDALTTEPVVGYAYAPAAGWATFSGTTTSPATVSLNGETVRTVTGAFTMPLPLAAGYNTIALKPLNPCLNAPGPVLRCLSVDVRGLTLAGYTPYQSEQITFANGITLTSYELAADGVHLAWNYAAPPPENTVRFVHLLAADGTPALQIDGHTRAPVEALAFDGLQPGTYTAYVGWYTLADVVRLAVRSDVEGAADGWARLGQVTVR